jgi:hypothetical protein
VLVTITASPDVGNRKTPGAALAAPEIKDEALVKAAMG